MRPDKLFLEQLPLIERVIYSICRRNCCFGDEAEDFASWAHLKLIDNDYAILSKFQGKSSLATYLTTVIHNLFRDYRISKWGKWRPSAKARRLGEEAVQLETLVTRDGHALTEAIEILRTNYKVAQSRRQLEELASELPVRLPRKFEGELALEDVTAPDRVEQRVQDAEKAQIETRAEAALAAALSELGTEERLLLKMRFQEGFTVARIASALGLEQRPLYRRFDVCLKRLRTKMIDHGVHASEINELLGWDRGRLAIDYDIEEEERGKSTDASV